MTHAEAPPGREADEAVDHARAARAVAVPRLRELALGEVVEALRRLRDLQPRGLGRDGCDSRQIMPYEIGDARPLQFLIIPLNRTKNTGEYGKNI